MERASNSLTTVVISKNQRCVFCGEKPDKKTKEHILPQWLLRLTGDPNRQANFGADFPHYLKTKEFRIRKFAFSSFKFPACDECNNHYANLEARVEKVMHKILSDEYLNSNEIVDLLDWLDKVRTGLWLAYNSLDNLEVEPKFYIRRRSAIKDRLLFVYEAEDKSQRLLVSGMHTPTFTHMPSCFAIAVNNKIFYSESTDFLVSSRLGFPTGILHSMNAENGNPMFRIHQGKERIKYPIKTDRYLKGGMEIYQPIFSRSSPMLDVANINIDFTTKYIADNSINAANGIGKIFYKDYNKVVALDIDDTVDIKPYKIEKDFITLFKDVNKMVFDSQLHLLERYHIGDKLAKHPNMKGIFANYHALVNAHKAMTRAL